MSVGLTDDFVILLLFAITDRYCMIKLYTKRCVYSHTRLSLILFRSDILLHVTMRQPLAIYVGPTSDRTLN